MISSARKPQGTIRHPLSDVAASLMIMREDGRVLWVQRGERAPFLGSYWAFPGGMVSEQDIGSQLENEESILKRTALRESAEELLIPLDPNLADTNALEMIGDWSTHPYLPKRIKCYFFSSNLKLLRLDQEVIPIGLCPSHPELDDRRWLSGSEMYEMWQRGEVTIAPPTLAICRALAFGYPLVESVSRSPELQVINQVLPWLQLIPVKSPTLPPATHTNTYLLGEKSFYLIDPGSSSLDALTHLFDQIDKRLASAHRFEGVILTHHHHDHVSGLKIFLDRYHEDRPMILSHPKTAALLWNHQLPSNYTALEEGDLINWERFDGTSDRCEIWHTPGHAPGHICLIHSSSDTAIVGDMVASVGTIIVDPSDGDMGEYFSSLKRLKRRHFKRLLPSHGAPIANPNYILESYIDHRIAREEKIYRSLTELPIHQTRDPDQELVDTTDEVSCVGQIEWKTLRDIVDIAYYDAPESVKIGKYGGLAGRSALSHLIHLQSQRRVLCSEPTPRLKSRWIRYHDSLDTLALSTARLQQMMSTLREQCPWDRAQNLDSLRRYLIEESYEVLDSLNDPNAHREELGDLFFQVLFQSIIRQQQKMFSLADVMDTLAAKLARRHPHVFGDLTVNHPDEVRKIWNEVKAQERAEKSKDSHKDESILDGVPSAAPALLRAQIIGEKVSAVGFDWPSIEGALAKIDEERIEVAEAIDSGDRAEMTAEIGDLLFAIVNVCRHLSISPELALETSNQTFSSRFRHVERLARLRGLDLHLLHIDDIEDLWREAKHLVKTEVQ